MNDPQIPSHDSPHNPRSSGVSVGSEPTECDGGQWYACSEPERPTDAYVIWHYHDCRACSFKADALEWQFPDDAHVQWLREQMRVDADA